jgi:ribosomal protein S18 acetylase RimI-like enzyme
MLEESPDYNRAADTEKVEALVRQLFGHVMDLDAPLPGEKDSDVVATNLHEMVSDPTTIVAELIEDGELAGFSLAVPIGKMDAARVNESNETAYIYFTGVRPELQGMGLVGKVMEDMHGKLQAHGYHFMERDCLIADGYADNVEKAYGDAIVQKNDHTKWPEIGPERNFRIDLAKLV